MSERLNICMHAGTEGECESVVVPDVRALKRERATLKKYLRELIQTNRHAIRVMDTLMKQPSTHERGQKIAQVLNAIEFATDSADHFGLGNKLVTRDQRR